MNLLKKQIVLLTLVAFFISCSHHEERFMTAEQHQANLARVKELNSQMLRDLSKYGVNPGSGLSLNFYFVTDDSMKAQGLANEVEKIGYHSNTIHQSAKDKTLWVLTGSTPTVNMDSSSLNAWSNGVCELGYKNDCLLQGWNPVSE